MAQLTLTIKYKKNEGSLLSPAEMWSLYLYGITIQGNTGASFSDEAIQYYIKAAQKEVENYFNLLFVKQLIALETTSYYHTDYWTHFPIIQTKFPVREPLSLVGMLAKIEQIIYPQGWLFCERDQAGIGKRRISIVPTGASTTEVNADVILTGISSQIGMQRFQNIPDYWNIQYITGFDLDKLPLDLIDIVGKLASIGILNIAGDLILGAGIASMSLSIDGLNQSIGTTSSAENSGYSARIKQYQKEIVESTKRIKLVYDEIKFMVL
jgi:hypothetical protein